MPRLDGCRQRDNKTHSGDRTLSGCCLANSCYNHRDVSMAALITTQHAQSQTLKQKLVIKIIIGPPVRTAKVPLQIRVAWGAWRPRGWEGRRPRWWKNTVLLPLASYCGRAPPPCRDCRPRDRDRATWARGRGSRETSLRGGTGGPAGERGEGGAPAALWWLPMVEDFPRVRGEEEEKEGEGKAGTVSKRSIIPRLVRLQGGWPPDRGPAGSSGVLWRRRGEGSVPKWLWPPLSSSWMQLDNMSIPSSFGLATPGLGAPLNRRR